MRWRLLRTGPVAKAVLWRGPCRALVWSTMFVVVHVPVHAVEDVGGEPVGSSCRREDKNIPPEDVPARGWWTFLTKQNASETERARLRPTEVDLR